MQLYTSCSTLTLFSIYRKASGSGLSKIAVLGKVFLFSWNFSRKMRDLILRITKQKPMYRQLKKNKSKSPVLLDSNS